MKNAATKTSQIISLKKSKNDSSEQPGQKPTQNKQSNNYLPITSHKQQLLSKDQLLQSFLQFGLETVIINDSFQNNSLANQHHHSSPSPIHKQQIRYQINGNNSSHPILQQNNCSHLQTNNKHKINGKNMTKLQQLKQYIIDIKAFIQNTFNQLQQQIANAKHENQVKLTQLLAHLQKKLIEITRINHKQKQLLKHEIQELKTIIQNINNQNKQLNEKIKQSNRQLNQNNSINNLDIRSEGTKVNQEISKLYEKHTQTLRQLNKQMLLLNKEIQFLTLENTKLRKLINQYDQKFREESIQIRNQQSRNFQSYNIFLQKIQHLQKQIKLIKKYQRPKQKLQLPIKINYTNQFLQIDQQKQKQIILQQQPLQNNQQQTHRRLSLQPNDLINTYSNDEQPRSKQNIPFQDIESPLSKKSAYGWGDTHDDYCSEKLIKQSKTPMSRSSLHVRIPFFLNQSSLEKSIPKKPSKHSDQINCRIMKIQCSINNQLNALGFGK